MKATPENLEKLAGYGPGWDGYQAAAPNRSSISDARRFLETATTVFDIDLEPDGTVNLVTGFGENRMCLAFDGGGTVTKMGRVCGQWSLEGTFTL